MMVLNYNYEYSEFMGHIRILSRQVIELSHKKSERRVLAVLK